MQFTISELQCIIVSQRQTEKPFVLNHLLTEGNMAEGMTDEQLQTFVEDYRKKQFKRSVSHSHKQREGKYGS